MRYPYLKTIIGSSLALLCMQANGQTWGNLLKEYQQAKDRGKVSQVLDIDNDTLLLNRNDGFYTSGLLYTHQYRLREANSTTTFGWRIGQTLYTASDIKLPPEWVGPPNHPYAGWLYGGFFKELKRPNGTYTRLGVDVGCLGPCAGGRWTQTTFHQLLSQPTPRGWSKQVKNELGVVLYGEWAPVRWQPTPSFDITPSFRARLGNIYTDAGAGMMLRAGQLNVSEGQSAWHGFLRVSTHAVGYNATLQGGYFSKNNPHTVQPKPWVGEAELGIAWNRGPYGLRVSLVRHSNEIDALPNSIGAQNFGRIQFSYSP